jgi:hypothetical protein
MGKFRGEFRVDESGLKVRRSLTRARGNRLAAKSRNFRNDGRKKAQMTQKRSRNSSDLRGLPQMYAEKNHRTQINADFGNDIGKEFLGGLKQISAESETRKRS